MKKNLFLSLCTAAGVLLAAACTMDESSFADSGNEAHISFALGIENHVSTKAISDGESADSLIYAIYDADKKLITAFEGSNNGLFTKSNAFQSGLNENVSVTLAKGQTYTAVFWAQNADCSAYTVSSTDDGLVLNINYEGENNDESRDAFFATKTFTVSGTGEIPVSLNRPFAQINVGVTQADWDDAADAGIEITKSKVVIKNAATSLNLLSGVVDGDQSVEVSYGYATIPAKFATEEILEVDTDKNGTIEESEKYKYLSMSYILPHKPTLEANGLVFTFSTDGTDSGKKIEFGDALHSVPVQANWRTNILGKILTGDIQFDITIDKEYDDNGNIDAPVTATVSNTEDLQKALNDPEVSKVVLSDDITLENGITFGALLKSSVSYSGRDFIFDGNGKTVTYKGAVGSRIIDFTKETAGANLTLKNVTITNNVSSIDDAVNYNTTGTLTLENVTINNAEGCTMSHGVNLHGASNGATVSIKNCEIWSNGITLNVFGANVTANVTDSKLYVVDANDKEGYAAVSLNNDGTSCAENSIINIEGGEVKVIYEGNGETCPSHAILNATLTGQINTGSTTAVTGQISNPAAIIYYEDNNQYYSCPTLQEAFDKVKQDTKGSVRLVKDLTIDKSITIAKDFTVKFDMNGYNLNFAVANDGKASAIFVNNGNLSIVNEKSDSESVLSFVASDPDLAAIPAYATNTITNETTLYIGAGVTITNGSNGGASYAVDNKGKFTLDGGKLVANRCALRIAKYNQDDVQFTMNSGTVTAVKPAWIQLPGSSNTAAPKITVVINDGLFQTTEENSEVDLFYTYSYGNSHANTSITINGGKFIGGTVSIGAGYKGDVASLTINGGTFSHDVLQWLENDESKVLYKANYDNTQTN